MNASLSPDRPRKILPTWKTKRIAAIDALVASYTPEEAEEQRAAFDRARANTLARREAKIERDRLIVAGLLDGATADEVRKTLGVGSREALRHFTRLGVSMGGPQCRRAPSAIVSVKTFDALRAFAAERGLSPAEIVGELLSVAFEENAFRARQLIRASTAAKKARAEQEAEGAALKLDRDAVRALRQEAAEADKAAREARAKARAAKAAAAADKTPGARLVARQASETAKEAGALARRIRARLAGAAAAIRRRRAAIEPMAKAA